MDMNTRCQYTGIEFEAASARTKNHPAISALLTDAARVPGAYGRVKEAITELREAGATELDTFLSAGRAAIDGRHDDIRQQVEAAHAADKAAKAQRRERERQNIVLREHGYRWMKAIVGTEDEWAGQGSYYAGIGEEAGHRWALVAPDGRTVSVADAMGEIGR